MNCLHTQILRARRPLHIIYTEKYIQKLNQIDASMTNTQEEPSQPHSTGILLVWYAVAIYSLQYLNFKTAMLLQL